MNTKTFKCFNCYAMQTVEVETGDQVLDCDQFATEKYVMMLNGIRRMTLKGNTLAALDEVKRIVPAINIIEFFGLTMGDMVNYEKHVKKQLIVQVKALFKQKAEFKETGEPVDFSDHNNNFEYFRITLTKAEILKSINTKKISNDGLQRIIDFFNEEVIIK